MQRSIRYVYRTVSMVGTMISCPLVFMSPRLMFWIVSFQWIHLPFSLNCCKETWCKDFMWLKFFPIYLFESYLIKVVIHQAFLIYWTLPSFNRFRDWMFFVFSWNDLSDEVTKLFSAIRVTAATHGPHQGGSKGCLWAKAKEKTFYMLSVDRNIPIKRGYLLYWNPIKHLK